MRAPVDEFDHAAQQPGAVGLHRAPRSVFKGALVRSLALLLIGGLLGYGYVLYLWREGGSAPASSPKPQVTISQSTGATPPPTASSSPEPETSPSAEPEPEPEPPAPVIRYDARIAVLNGAGIQGLAGRNQKILTDAGFTVVSATNLAGAKPAENVVRYADEDDEATAREVAARLGITNVELTATSGTDVDVVLVSQIN